MHVWLLSLCLPLSACFWDQNPKANWASPLMAEARTAATETGSPPTEPGPHHSGDSGNHTRDRWHWPLVAAKRQGPQGVWFVSGCTFDVLCVLTSQLLTSPVLTGDSVSLQRKCCPFPLSAVPPSLRCTAFDRPLAALARSGGHGALPPLVGASPAP